MNSYLKFLSLTFRKVYVIVIVGRSRLAAILLLNAPERHSLYPVTDKLPRVGNGLLSFLRCQNHVDTVRAKYMKIHAAVMYSLWLLSYDLTLHSTGAGSSNIKICLVTIQATPETNRHFNDPGKFGWCPHATLRDMHFDLQVRIWCTLDSSEPCASQQRLPLTRLSCVFISCLMKIAT